MNRLDCIRLKRAFFQFALLLIGERGTVCDAEKSLFYKNRIKQIGLTEPYYGWDLLFAKYIIIPYSALLQIFAIHVCL